MNEDRILDRLDHIRRAATNAMAFMEDYEKDDFFKDERTQQAVVMSLVIIGEAATKLVDENLEFTQDHAEIPWQKMRGLRNRITHGYFDIDFNVIWDTVKVSLPDLLQKISPICRDMHDERHADEKIGPA
jgi:uncharacterized protein with HEPN domain